MGGQPDLYWKTKLYFFCWQITFYAKGQRSHEDAGFSVQLKEQSWIKDRAGRNLMEAFTPLLSLPHLQVFLYSEKQRISAILYCFWHVTQTCSRTSAVTRAEPEQQYSTSVALGNIPQRKVAQTIQFQQHLSILPSPADPRAQTLLPRGTTLHHSQCWPTPAHPLLLPGRNHSENES